MKKLLLLFALVAGFTCGVKAEDKVTAKVSGTSLNIGLENTTTFCAFQMDITLPDGVTASAVAAVSDRLSQTGSDSEVGGTKFIVASNVIEGNVLRVIAYNLANAEITNATGDILNITLSSAPVQVSDIKVSNILFVQKSDLAEVDLGSATGENGAKIGDVNGDGKVNSLDVTCTIDITLGNGKSTYNTSAADVNSDNKVTALDVAKLIDIVLGK